LLFERGVELLSGGLDEVPGVYKDIHLVMSAQTDLVEVLGRFDPKLVKMCPAGDFPED
jgi:tRNA-splicing ligase RtcB